MNNVKNFLGGLWGPKKGPKKSKFQPSSILMKIGTNVPLSKGNHL